MKEERAKWRRIKVTSATPVTPPLFPLMGGLEIESLARVPALAQQLQTHLVLSQQPRRWNLAAPHQRCSFFFF